MGSRAVHLIIACVELLPLIGQIASIFEKCIAASHFQSIQMAETVAQERAVKTAQERAEAIASMVENFSTQAAQQPGCDRAQVKAHVVNRLNTLLSTTNPMDSSPDQIAYAIARISNELIAIASGKTVVPTVLASS